MLYTFLLKCAMGIPPPPPLVAFFSSLSLSLSLSLFPWLWIIGGSKWICLMCNFLVKYLKLFDLFFVWFSRWPLQTLPRNAAVGWDEDWEQFAVWRFSVAAALTQAIQSFEKVMLCRFGGGLGFHPLYTHTHTHTHTHLSLLSLSLSLSLFFSPLPLYHLHPC